MESDSSNSQSRGDSPEISPEEGSQESHSSSAQSLSPPGEQPVRPPPKPMTEEEKQCYSLISIMKDSGEYHRLCREIRGKLIDDGYESRLKEMAKDMVKDMVKNEDASDEELKRYREQALDRIMPVAMNSINENIRRDLYNTVRAMVERHLEFSVE